MAVGSAPTFETSLSDAALSFAHARSRAATFEHFGEQEVSWSAVGKYRAQVLALARQMFIDHGESLGGLILCAGAPLGRVFARLAPPGQRPDPDRQTCVTEMPRPDFDQLVRLHAPDLADALPEADPEWRRSRRTLPILVATANGHRLACVIWDADEQVGQDPTTTG